MPTNGRSSKAKGYAGEVQFIEAAAEYGRAGLTRNGNRYGGADRGDIAGVPGWVVQVKNVATAKIPEWVKDCKVQAANAGVKRWAIALKLRGHHMRDGVIMLPLSTFFELVEKAEAFESEYEGVN